MPKATTPRREARRHNPLEQDILATGPLKNKSKKKKGKDGEQDEGENFVDAKASRNILALGRELMEEDQASREAARIPPTAAPDAFAFESRFGARPDEEPADDDDEDGHAFADEDEAWGAEEEEVEEIELDPEDRETFNRFLPADGEDDPLLKYGFGARPPPGTEEEGGGTNLADLILERIAAFESAEARQQGLAPADDDYELPEKVVDVYSKVGLILSRYRSGKLPKPFKILPTVPHWEDVLEVTKPDEWSHNAIYEATRIFVSAKPAVVEGFLERVLLPRVREDIYETRKLNPHLFAALKKGLYKPSAWFKGFLFPLVASGTCTLREAHIVAGVLTRVSVPVLQSAAAIGRLCEIAAEEASQGTEGGGATNIFIKALLDKRYALPWSVVDSLVFHFLRFRSTDPAAVTEGEAMKVMVEGRPDVQGKLPVIWHQCLLVFVQRYRDEITEDQREALLDLLLTHGHSGIGPEVRRELVAGRNRGVPLAQPGPALDGDDTMLVDG